jgi:hypothetical protein
MKIFIKVFPMIFQSLMGPKNQGVIVPSGPPKETLTHFTLPTP